MRSRPLALLVLSVGCPLVCSLISKHDAELAPLESLKLLDDVGLAAGATISVEFTLSASDASPAYLLLLTSEQSTGWYDNIHGDTAMQEGYVVCGSPSYGRYELTLPDNVTAVDGNRSFSVQHTDLYTLHVAYCGAGRLRCRLRTAFMNPPRNHLAIENVMSVPLYKGLLATYTGLAALWCAECWLMRQFILPVHLGCVLSLLAKCVEIAIQHQYLLLLNKEGAVDEGFWVVKELSASLSQAVFLCVLLLISLGWTMTRDHLTPRERYVLGGIFGVYIAILGLKVDCERGGGDTCQAFVLSEYVIRSLILLAIIVAMNFNITHLRQGVNDMPPPINAALAVQYSKLHQFQVFRWAFLAYLLSPTALLIIKVTVLSWEYEWLNEYASHVLFLVIHVVVAATLAPSPSALITQGFTTAHR